MTFIREKGCMHGKGINQERRWVIAVEKEVGVQCSVRVNGQVHDKERES